MIEILDMEIDDMEILATVYQTDELVRFKCSIWDFEKWVRYNDLLEWQTPDQVPSGDCTSCTFDEFIHDHNGFAEFGEQFILEKLNIGNDNTRHN